MKKALLTIIISFCLLGLSACASTSNSESTGQYLDSTTITTKVKSNLASKVGVGTLRSINVTTYKGVVQLSGFVKSKQEIDAAVKTAKNVSGVKSVENSLLVRKDTD